MKKRALERSGRCSYIFPLGASIAVLPLPMNDDCPGEMVPLGDLKPDLLIICAGGSGRGAPTEPQSISTGRTELCALNWGWLRLLRAYPNRVCPPMAPIGFVGETTKKKEYLYMYPVPLRVRRNGIRWEGHAGGGSDRHE